jgi:hypothetical protein
MISFLFWNLAKNSAAAPHVARIARSRGVDVFLFAECPADSTPLLAGLTALKQGAYRDAGVTPSKIRAVTRLSPSDFAEAFTNEWGDLTVWRVTKRMMPALLVASVHLPSKAGGGNVDVIQATRAQSIAREISQFEDTERSRNTVLVGDLNMNPFDAGVVTVNCLHGHLTKTLARRDDRSYLGESYPRFYNPMWGLFGDRTPGPPGTYFWESYNITNQHWAILDQVLLRPSLIDKLHDLQILDSDGAESLLGPEGFPTKEHLSDHLPVLFRLDV